MQPNPSTAGPVGFVDEPLPNMPAPDDEQTAAGTAVADEYGDEAPIVDEPTA